MINLMKHQRESLSAIITFAMMFSLTSLNVIAKDLSDEKYQVRMAQREYDKANQDYETLSGTIKELEKRITQQNQQLDILKKSLPVKEERLSQAQKILDEKQLVLDKAWDENKK